MARRKRVTHNDGQKQLVAPPGIELKKRTKVRFDYIKSNNFRVIRVDGVHGGATPRADGVQIAFFSERTAIPTSEEFPIAADGKLGKRTHVEQRDAVVREVEVEAILSIEMAKQLEGWLHEKIEQIAAIRELATRNSR